MSVHHITICGTIPNGKTIDQLPNNFDLNKFMFTVQHCRDPTLLMSIEHRVNKKLFNI